MDDKQGPMSVPWPPILFICSGSLAIIGGTFVPLPWLRGPFAEFLVAIGVVMAVVGALLILMAARRLHRSSTPISPMRPAEHLVTGGAFAFSRNPIYLGLACILLAMVPITGNLWFAVAMVLFALAASALAIRPEERQLERRFGKVYRDYAKRVRRWF